MPFTPYHFGPSALFSIPLRKYIDIFVFVFASISVDLEPLIVMVFNLNYPLHGYCHTFLFGSFIGLIWGGLTYLGKNIIKSIMKFIRLEYSPNLLKMLISWILGVWFHILFDAPLYSDIKPFFPLQTNPLYGLFSHSTVYNICKFSIIPAIIVYIIAVIWNKRNKKRRETNIWKKQGRSS